MRNSREEHPGPNRPEGPTLGHSAGLYHCDLSRDAAARRLPCPSSSSESPWLLGSPIRASACPLPPRAMVDHKKIAVVRTTKTCWFIWAAGGRVAARRQARAQRQARARAVVRRAHRPVCRCAGRWEGAVAQGRVRGACRVRGGGMRVGGGEQRVLSTRGGAVLLARVPAHGLEGAQAGLHGGTAVNVGES